LEWEIDIEGLEPDRTFKVLDYLNEKNIYLIFELKSIYKIYLNLSSQNKD